LKKYLFILFLLCTFNLSAQTYNYSYTDPCTGNLKTIVVPINGNVTVSYYGELGSFNANDFTNGNFESWASGIFNQYGQDSPCSQIVGLGTAVNVTQSTTLNVIGILNSLSTIASLTGGATNVLGGAVGSVSNSSGDGESNSNDNKNNNGNNNPNNNPSNPSGGGSSIPNQPNQNPQTQSGGTQEGTGTPITSQISFTIPAGIYSCDNLATFMSRQIQKCNEVNNTSYNNATFGYYGPNVNNNVRLETALTNLYLDNWDDDYYKLYVGDIRGQLYAQEVVIVPLLNATDLNTRGSNGYNRNYITCHYPTGFTTLYGGFVGASEFSVQFNNENSSKFEFTYTHTPLKDSATGNEVVCFRRNVNNGSVKYVFNNRMTGILFQDLQPRAFWQQLGFDVDNMIFTPQQIMNREITLQQFENATTKNYMSYTNMYGKTGFEIKDDQDTKEADLQLTSQFQTEYPINIYYSSEKTWPILAIDPPISSSTSSQFVL